MNNELSSKTLAQIVNSNFQTASVFEKYNLDFCCKGKRSLQDACVEKNLPVKTVVDELQLLFNNERTTVDFDKLSLAQLANYIVSTHHAYTKKELPQIFAYLEKVSTKHGDRHKELYLIFENFSNLKNEMELHMRKEELILFPKIKEMENVNQNQQQIPMNIQMPITVMEGEHEHAGNLLKAIRNLSNNYNPPADACTTYKLSFTALQAFEKDLHQHIHLENNILFPKAIELFRKKQGSEDHRQN
jgi:regulator of cell morphogenesis and NO signaling